MAQIEIDQILKQGEDFFAVGDIEKAKDCFENILSADSKHIEALNNLGVIAFQEGDHEQASLCFHKALEIDENYVEALENLIKCLVTKGDFLEAVNLFQKALKLGVLNTELLNSMAQCFIQLKDLSSAKQVLDESLKIDGNQEEVRNLLKKIEYVTVAPTTESIDLSHKDRLNIGFVTIWFERGQAYVSKALRDSVADEHNTFIFARTGSVYSQPKLESQGCWDVPNLTMYPEYEIPPGVIVKWIQDNQLDVIIFNEEYDWNLVEAAKSTGIKVLTYLDYYKEDWKPYMRLYDAVLCSTERSFNLAKTVCNAYYIGWGVDTELFKPRGERKQQYTFFHNAGWLGFNYRKMTPTAILAFDTLSKELDDITLFVHAQVPMQGLPKEIVSILKRNNRITYHNETIPAPGLYHKGKILVFPSKLEGLGLPLFEALSCGLPVITVDAPPMNEFIIHEYTGLITKVRRQKKRTDDIAFPESIIDFHDFIKQMRELATNSNKIEEMSKNARIYSVEKLNTNFLKKRLIHALNCICKSDHDGSLFCQNAQGRDAIPIHARQKTNERSIHVGMFDCGVGWRNMVEQEGINYAVYNDLVDCNASDCPVLIVGRSVSPDEAKVLRSYLMGGGGIISTQDNMSIIVDDGATKGAYEHVTIERIEPSPHPLFSGVDIIHLNMKGIVSSKGVCGLINGKLAIWMEKVGRGTIIGLPFDVNGALSDRRITKRSFQSKTGKEAFENVSLINKAEVSRLAVNCIRELFFQRGFPYVHLHYYPGDYESAFAFRVDSDGYHMPSFAATYQVAKESGLSMTWFLDVGRQINDLDKAKNLERLGQDVQLHCFRHLRRSDKLEHFDDIRLGIEFMTTAGLIRPMGVAAPWGEWSEELNTVMESLDIKYSSEFSLSYDGFPFWPILENNACGKVLQIPIHPSCIGIMLKGGFSNTEMIDYFEEVIQRKLSRMEPIFFYGHPIGRIAVHPEVISKTIAKVLSKRKIWITNLSQFYLWWNRRRQLSLNLLKTDEGFKILTNSNEKETWVHNMEKDAETGDLKEELIRFDMGVEAERSSLSIGERTAHSNQKGQDFSHLQPNRKETETYFDASIREKRSKAYRSFETYSMYLDYLTIEPDKKILDAGCGVGQLLKAASEHDLVCYGVDLSKETVLVARKTAPLAHVEVSNMEGLPFENDTFDYLTCLGSLQYCVDIDRALREFVRVTREDAKLCILVPNKDFLFGATPYKVYRQIFSFSEWVSIFKRNGLAVCNVYADNTVCPNREIPFEKSYQFAFICKKGGTDRSLKEIVTGSVPPLKLCITADGQTPGGYTPVILKDLISIDNGGIKPLPFETGVADEIIAHKVLEWISIGNLPAVLKEWLRVLKPCGFMTIISADLREKARLYVSGDISTTDLIHMLYGEQETKSLFRGSGFDSDYLKSLLIDAGATELNSASTIEGHVHITGQKRNVIYQASRRGVVLQVGATTGYHTERYTKLSLGKIGYDVYPFDYRSEAVTYGLSRMNDRLVEKAIELKPDMILIHKGEMIMPEAIRMIKEKVNTKVVVRYPDQRGKCEDWIVRLNRETDFYFQTTGWKKQLLDYERLGVKSANWLMQGISQDVHKKIDLTPEEFEFFGSDVVFVGTYFEWAREKKELIDAIVEAGFDFKIWGPSGWPESYPYQGRSVYEKEFTKVCNASRIAININSVSSDIPYYFSNRYFLTMGCGVFSLVRYVPGLEDIFENRKHLVWFHNTQEAIEFIAYYLAHPDERDEIAEQGYKEVHQNHTYDQRIQQMLRITGLL